MSIVQIVICLSIIISIKNAVVHVRGFIELDLFSNDILLDPLSLHIPAIENFYFEKEHTLSYTNMSVCATRASPPQNIRKSQKNILISSNFAYNEGKYPL